MWDYDVCVKPIINSLPRGLSYINVLAKSKTYKIFVLKLYYIVAIGSVVYIWQTHFSTAIYINHIFYTIKHLRVEVLAQRSRVRVPTHNISISSPTTGLPLPKFSLGMHGREVFGERLSDNDDHGAHEHFYFMYI